MLIVIIYINLTREARCILSIYEKIRRYLDMSDYVFDAISF